MIIVSFSKQPLTERNTYSKPPTSSTPKVMTLETVLKVLKYLYKRKEKEYSLDDLSQEQREVVLATVVDTIVKLLNNDKSYKPLQAKVMGCGGTGKSFIINTILTLVRKMTWSNNTVLVGAPSGSAAYNVQGSTLHHLLEIGVSRPEDDVTQKVQDKL